jgi:tetratricopeptide (TPR) repeat protein
MKKILFQIAGVIIFSWLLLLPAQKSLAYVPPEEIFAAYELIESWQIPEATQYIQTLIERYPESGDVQFLHGRTEFFRGNYDFARNILNRVSDNRKEVEEFKNLVNNTREAADKFVSKETKHFILRYREGRDQILLPFAEQVLESSYQTLGDLFDFWPQEKVIVEFYSDRRSLAQVSPLTIKDIMTSGTVALCKYNRIMMISPASLVRGYNWMDTLSHEYIHYILTRKSQNRFPLWLHEGVAKHFETRWRQENGHLAPILETVLASGLANDYTISLNAMMPSFAKLKTAEDVQLAYAQVSTMVEYMTYLQDEKIFSHLLSDLAKNVPFDEALEKCLRTDLKTFQINWKQHLKTKDLKIIPGLKPLKTRFRQKNEDAEKNEYKELESRRARDLTFIGDILKSRNMLKAAILEYEKAINLSQALSPILSNKLGLAYIFNKEYEPAEIILKKTIQHFPNFHTTLTNLGELYHEMGNYEQSQSYFEKALRINPFNPFVHVRLMDVYERLGLEEDKKQQEKLYKLIN